ncbi:MAG: hypothetical protein ACK5AN_15565, partial [Planctomyces sp.]
MTTAAAYAIAPGSGRPDRPEAAPPQSEARSVSEEATQSAAPATLHPAFFRSRLLFIRGLTNAQQPSRCWPLRPAATFECAAMIGKIAPAASSSVAAHSG